MLSGGGVNAARGEWEPVSAGDAVRDSTYARSLSIHRSPSVVLREYAPGKLLYVLGSKYIPTALNPKLELNTVYIYIGDFLSCLVVCV